MEAATSPMTAGAADERGVVPSVPSMAFADVYRGSFGFVWRSARALGTSPAALEDVVQEIFVVVHRRLSEFEGRSTLRTWLSGIVLNVVRHHRRSLVRKSPHELAGHEPTDPDVLPSHARDPHEMAERAEGTRLVQRALDTLDEEKREVLVLAELEELPVPEIAEALGLKLNTAYSRLRLAREQFEAAIQRQRAQDLGRLR
jgi:RNA polymerase sigma-70 factor (ECF subfamily)